jgi:sigma-B regulation protein RsbU (phosphoserine phosphatase)
MSIIIVDHDPDIRLLLSRVLVTAGFPVPVALTSAQEALLYFTQAHSVSEPRLALINVRLTGQDGIELCRQLRALPAHADLTVLMLTTDPDSPSLHAAYDAGAMDYLRLPLQHSELILRVRSALRLDTETRQRKLRESELQSSLATVRQSLQAAGRLQRSLLPTRREPVPGVTVAWHFAPCEEVGGDLFDVLALSDGSLAFYLVDVAGHGVPAALFSVGLHHLLSARESASPLETAQGLALAPDQVLMRLNRDFQMAGESLLYFTMVYGTLSPEGALRFVQAGHPGLILCAPGEPVRLITEGGMPVGLLPQAVYQTQNLPLPLGARVLLYSDGASEAANADGELFGQERLQAVVEATRQQPLADMVAAVEQAVADWLAPGTAQDDLSLLAFERQQRAQ